MSSASPTTRKTLPPGPRGLPILGSLHKIRGPGSPHIAISEMAREYGDVSLIRLGNVPTVVISHPDILAEAFAREELSDRFANSVFTATRAETGMSFSPYGERWQGLNQMVKEHLLSSRDVSELTKAHFEPAIDEMVTLMCEAADSGELVKVHSTLYESVYNLTFRVLFGKREYEEEWLLRWKDALLERVLWLRDAFATPVPADFFPWMKILPNRLLREAPRQQDAHDRILQDLVNSVRERRISNTPAVPGLVDIMLDYEEAGKISREDTRALCMETIGASLSVAGVAVNWFLLIVANRPEVQRRIHAELDRVIGSGGPPTTTEDRGRLPYTFASVVESMRYRTVVPFAVPHKTTRDVEVGGYRVPEGTQVFGNIYSIHHDERYWDSPNDFMPERFLPEADGSPSSALSSPAYMPFGAGTRRCPGDYFGMAIVWVFTVRIMRELRFETPGGDTLSEEEVLAFTVEPNPYSLRAVRR